jgi:hypothetical protein
MSEMKKIHGLLDDIVMEDENLDIVETNLSKEEKNRIMEMTLNKAGLKRKSLFGRKSILPLAAAMTLVLSFAAVFAQGGLSNIYYKLFGDSTRYVTEMGTVIDESSSTNGITLNVASMLGDENTFYIIFELIKENGESFENSDYIYFDKLYLELNSSGGYTWYQIEDDDNKDNIATFILAGNTKKKVAGNKLTLRAIDITEYSIDEPASKFDPYSFLSNNPDYLQQGFVKNLEKSTMDTGNADEYSQEELKKIEEMYRLTPNFVLPWKYSNIPMADGINEIFIDNIGFVENKLCIRITESNSQDNSIGEIYFVNADNTEDILSNEFMFAEEKNDVKYYYYIFDIKDMEELENYKLYYDIVRKMNTTSGEWKVTFKADYKNMTETRRIDKEVTIDGKRYLVKNIKISPIALNVELKNNLSDNFDEPIHNLYRKVSVVMKDGSIIEPSSSGASTNAFGASINLTFEKPINTAEIGKIIIGDMEIIND